MCNNKSINNPIYSNVSKFICYKAKVKGRAQFKLNFFFNISINLIKKRIAKCFST
jgi:hypothetical protein